MEDDKQFCVKWGNHHGALFAVLESLLNDETYVDCTLAAEGKELSAHKVILSACSPYLNKLLKKHQDKHPIILMKDISFFDLQCVLDYVYKGEVNVQHDQLASFLKTAETLQITGLSGVNDKTNTKVFSKDDLLAEIMEDDLEEDDIDEVSVIDKKKDDEPGDKEEDTQDDTQDVLIEDEEGLKPSFKLENIEYLAEQDESQTDFDVEKEDENGYQLYLVDDETGTLKAMTIDDGLTADEKENDGNRIIKDFLQQVSILEDDKYKTPQPKKLKLMPDKLTSPASSEMKPKMRPKSVLHREDYNISCSKCGGLYKHEATYMNHLRHDCNQSHVCIACNKVFKNKRHLLDHIRDDCGRVHMCPNCKKYFKQKVNLTTHMKHYCKPEKFSRGYKPEPVDPLSEA